MRWIAYLHTRTSLFMKVLVANAAIVLVGSTTAVLFVNRVWHGERPAPFQEALFVVVGLVISLVVNFAILRVAFRPLFTLESTLDRVRRGDFSARVPDVEGDPALTRLSETTNLVLDRLSEHRQSLAAQILRAQEAERKRIARELHDETSQALTSVLFNLEAVEQQLPHGSEELSRRLDLTKEIARRTLDETRRLMFDLRPLVLDDLGLVPALRWFLSQRVQPMGLQVDLQVSGFDTRLPEELETALFRILQEAVSNVVKHAKAKNLSITLTHAPGQVIGVVQDDGVGFHPVHVAGKADRDRGLGLFGMHERAALVGGSVQIESAPGRGTKMRVTVPDRVGGKEAGG